MPTGLRTFSTPPPIDGEALCAALDEIGRECADPGVRRAEVVRLLRATLDRGRADVRARLDAGAGGIETARLLAQLVDEIVVALHRFAVACLSPGEAPLAQSLSVVAVGGYGRGTMAPCSDIDLLFLKGSRSDAGVEPAIQVMLYTLWDVGFKVGHASRTVDECLRFAREDFTIRTSLLEARWVAGDQGLADALKRRFRREVVDGSGAEFVAAKLAERDARHSKAGASRYMVEPDVKEGKGGLRDLNTLFWIAQYLHPVDQPSELVRLQEFTRREVKAFVRAFDFLWATRCYMHFITRRPEERLTFDLQPEVARLMGYADATGALGETASVERFMRRYFLIAREVGVLTRIFCAKLEAEHAKQPQGLARLLPRRAPRQRELEDAFYEEAGRLNVRGEQAFAADPVRLIRIFKVADANNLDLHPDAFATVTRSLNLIGAKLRRDPAAARAFLDVLAFGQETFRTLTLMNEAGVLGRFLPEFGRIVGQMQFNMYHAYTTDEHTLRGVDVIAELAAGRLAKDHPLAVSVLPLVADREALFLAVLLHDTGKGGAPGGQSLAGARNARIACERLGLNPERVDTVAWLVEHHLLMSETAQKRDLGDPRTISAFARTVAEPERLRALAILTAADIRAVGPGVWNGWKGQLLRQLYMATEAVFRGGRPSDLGFESVDDVQQVLAASARKRLAAAHPEAAEAVRRWAGSMEDAYFVPFPARAQAQHFALVERAERDGAAASARLMADWNAVEITVAARDRRGLFADLAGAMAGLGANIVGARVYTSASGGALDVFSVQDSLGGPYGEGDARGLDRLLSALERAGRGEGAEPAPEAAPLGRAAAFAVAPRVVVDNDASDMATVVEVSGRDRPGLLQALARTFASAGLSVQSAHVESFGERAVDAFYLITADGLKLSDPHALSALKAALTAVLLEIEPAVERVRAKAAARAG
ncbi:[protein-PII] uridylyltransferase [Caulobacter sp. S45]|uniref:[protein-PII] uridylyltransferase n=1 Tax=Caulobacter sp. S45 TaxID=1641861 RepID=UPI0015756B77|nr:[protein-PII] uridylyltransferase [Caulobacter sp. S45]